MPKSGYSSNNQQQRQRSKAGAVVLKSKKEAEQDKLRRVDKQLAKAADLEAQLGALLSNGKTSSDENKAYKLRSHLCEVLSDVLISNPRVSLEKDCFQRLWRGCFYNPIRIWRQQVSREKRKRSPKLATTQEGFKHFLAEAVTLYEYLILQYLSILCPSSTQQDANMTQQSKDTCTTSTTMYDRSQLEDTQYASQSTSATATTAVASPTEGAVHGLYKLYIFMGDLHRYAEAYNKAEANYLNASKLGPGLGNPYNQLAVVAFSKETFCVALYWYARSILATHERFSTSSNNLERLFSSNREFLLEHGRDSGTPKVLPPPAPASKSGGKNSKNKNNNSMQREMKVAASRSCLTHFVDLHYDLYLLKQREEKISSATNADTKMETDVDDGQVRQKIEDVMASLKSLVQASGFSDSLLCKIVVINSFSMQRGSDDAAAHNTSMELAEELCHSMGLVLVEHTEGLLTKALEKAGPKKAAPSVRCLLPLEMMLEFCNLRFVQKDENENADPAPTELEFWKGVSRVANLVRNVVKAYNIARLANDDGATHHWAQIKEYQLLKGYRPFSTMNEEYLSNKDGFLNITDAVDVLELTGPTQSQDTGAVSNISNAGPQESKARLLQMLDICDQLASPSSGAPMVLANEAYSYHETNSSPPIDDEMTGKDDVEMESQEGGHAFGDNDSEDEAGDVILYNDHNTMPESDNSHASSESVKHAVDPSAPLASPSAEEKLKSPVNSVEPVSDVIMAVAEEKTPTPIVPAMIKPPPGFGGSPTAPTVLSNQTTSVGTYGEHLMNDNRLSATTSNPATSPPGLPLPSPTGRGIHDQFTPGMTTTGDSSSLLFQMPQQQQPQPSILPMPGLTTNISHHDAFYPLQNGRSNLPTSLEESVRIFGDIQTANPFVMQSSPMTFPMSNTTKNPIVFNGQNENTVPSIIPNFLSENTSSVDDTKWLNSNLLNGLWMDETSKTNNPWASK